MKKIYILLAILIVISLLAACGTEVEESIAATEWNDTAPTITEAPAATQSIDDVDTSAYYARVIEEQDDALTPFVREAVAQGIDADHLFSDYLQEMALPDNGICFQKTEREMSANGIILRTAVLLKDSVGYYSSASLDELTAKQYEDICGYDDCADSRTYQVVGLAINGSYVKAEFSVSVNGQEIGTYSIDNNVLLLPIDAPASSIDRPVEISLTVLSGNLPTPDYIYVGVHSNLFGGG